MILTCPSCSTRYQADGARFVAPGRNVRCAKCGHVWFQTAPSPEPEPEPVFEQAENPGPDQPPNAAVVLAPLVERVTASQDETPSPRPKLQRPPRGGAVGGAIAWAALIFLAATIGWAAVQYRQTIAELWPGLAPLYGVIGLPVDPEGIELTEIAYQHEIEDGHPVLAVMGK